MLDAAALALRDILSPPFRGVLWKSLALTIGLLVALWVALEWLLANWVAHRLAVARTRPSTSSPASVC